jgi:dTDP-4-dehydrorhamnose 3,5-epimerase-like enzyme
MDSKTNPTWKGLKSAARTRLETRDYGKAPIAQRLGSTGVGAGEAIESRTELSEVWIPGVEIFARRVFQQKGRGYFGELVRVNEGTLGRIGLRPTQWASALMHRDSAKGFHIHPPHVPDGAEADDWFRKLYIDAPEDYSCRLYDREQWDVMFFLTGICEMILVDERDGLTRNIMRFTIAGDSRPGADNAAVVIPPGVGHALRSIGNEDLIMVYGTSTTFNPDWEGRIESAVENAPLPPDWADYLERGRG